PGRDAGPRAAGAGPARRWPGTTALRRRGWPATTACADVRTFPPALPRTCRSGSSTVETLRLRLNQGCARALIFSERAPAPVERPTRGRYQKFCLPVIEVGSDFRAELDELELRLGPRHGGLPFWAEDDSPVGMLATMRGAPTARRPTP